MDSLSDIDWKTLFLSFEGRVTRRTCWIGTLVIIALCTALSVVGGILGAIFGPLAFIPSILSLALVYPALAVSAKRWHDRGKSGWWSLVNLIPLGCFYALYELGLMAGVEADNQFGANPQAVAA